MFYPFNPLRQTLIRLQYEELERKKNMTKVEFKTPEEKIKELCNHFRVWCIDKDHDISDEEIIIMALEELNASYCSFINKD